MHQRRWLELIKDNDLEVQYYPGKANVVADALIRKTQCSCIFSSDVRSLCLEMEGLNLDYGAIGVLC